MQGHYDGVVRAEQSEGNIERSCEVRIGRQGLCERVVRPEQRARDFVK